MKKILIAVAVIGAVCIVALVVVLTLSLDSLIKKGVETVGPKITQTEMKLEGVSVSMLSGSGTLKGFLLGNPEGYKTTSAIQFGEASVGVKPMSVLSDKIHVTHVRVVAPEINFEGSLGSKNNLSKLMENVEAATGGAQPADSGGEKPKSEPAAGGASKKLQVDDFLISGAKVKVTLTALGGRTLSLSIPDIHLTNLGTGPEGITPGELTKLVLKGLNTETFKAVEKAVSDLGKQAADAIKDVTKGGPESLDKAAQTLKGVGDLFKKK